MSSWLRRLKPAGMFNSLANKVKNTVGSVLSLQRTRRSKKTQLDLKLHVKELFKFRVYSQETSVEFSNTPQLMSAI